MTKKKIAHLQVLPIMSGVQKISLEIFRHLDRDKYDIYLICAPASIEYGGSLIEEAEKLGVYVITVPSLKRSIGWHDFATFKNLIRIFKKEQFDIIHTHSSKTGFLGRIAAKIAGCPYIIHTVHGIAFHKHQNIIKQLLFFKLELLSGLCTDKIVSVNQYYRRYFRGIFASKFMTIYNAIDYSKIDLKHDKKDGVVRVLFVGRLDKQKNPFGFIKAAEILLKENREMEFYLAGTGEYYDEIKEYLNRKKLQEKIHLLGWVEDINIWLSRCDIFCSSSIYEAFGLVFCEAGFAKLPTVAIAVEGVPEVVLHNKTGFLVPVNNEEKMAQRIAQLADNESLRLEFGEAAHKWVTEKFKYENFIQQYLRLYEQL